MIIYGTRGKQLKKGMLVRGGCSHCENNQHLAVGVVKYFHIFWIPFLVFSKQKFLQCTHCRHTKEMSKIDEEQHAEAIKKLFSFKKTWAYYFGLWFILIAMAFAIISEYLPK